MHEHCLRHHVAVNHTPSNECIDTQPNIWPGDGCLTPGIILRHQVFNTIVCSPIHRGPTSPYAPTNADGFQLYLYPAS